MSGPNPFDDVAKDIEESDDHTEDDSEDDESQPKVDQSDTEIDESTTATSTSDRVMETESTDTSRETVVEGPTLKNSSPPFPYSEAKQKQMYVQDGLWEDFEDLGFNAELELRQSFDVRNVEHRELDTAIIQLVLDQFTASEIAEMVVQMRGFDPSG